MEFILFSYSELEKLATNFRRKIGFQFFKDCYTLHIITRNYFRIKYTYLPISSFSKR